MPSSVSRLEASKPDPKTHEATEQLSETAGVTGTGVDVTAEGKKIGGKRKREVKSEIEHSIDDRSHQESKKNKKVKAEVEVGEESEIKPPSPATSKGAKRSTKIKVKEETVISKIEDLDDTVQAPTRVKRKNKKTAKEEGSDINGGEKGAEDHSKEDTETPNKVKRKRKTKEEKEAEAMPIAARTTGLRMFVGAHVSGAKGWSQRSTMELRAYVAILELRQRMIPGVYNSITNCLHVG